jgi:hypothetical protein
MSYYSGQGTLYVAERNSNGTPKGFITIGNVPKLDISIETEKFEHKESMSGQRAVDLSIVKEKKATFSLTMEDMSPSNLAMAFWGTAEAQTTGTFTDLPLVARVHATMDMRVPVMNYLTGVAYVGLSTLVLGNDATPTTTYQFGTTDGDTVNSKNGYVDQANGTIVIFSTAKQTARAATVVIADAAPLFVNSGNYVASQVTHAFTQTSMERWMRFEGLNTIDGKAVIIDMFKASFDPLSGYPLINEELASFEVTGSMLYDALQPGTSKFFRQINA